MICFELVYQGFGACYLKFKFTNGILVLYNASRKRIEFKLAYNFSSSSARLNTWVDAAKTFYRQLVMVESDDQKAIEKYAKTIGDNPSWALVKRIRNVEENIKRSISISSSSQYRKVTDMLKFQQATEAGATRLLRNQGSAIAARWVSYPMP